ncbi:MAG TPA: GxxExxY protein [Pyrinomonadaceae bacterium]|nr:GxxExxY protein [Pyrinomonadaceae bacterium]
MTDYELTQNVIGCAMKVHSALGPGLLESAYQECLFFELVKAGLFVEKQKPMPFFYSDVKLECGYRVDLMIEQRLILEIKSVEAINDIHLAQVLTYLKLANCRFGLIMNFNVLHLREGIRRVVNRYDDSASSAKTSAASAVNSPSSPARS